MAKASIEIIQALKATVKKLENSKQYQWGHMGSCNCGHLAQEVTKLKKDEIHRRAMERYGDWSEQLNDYCPTSGLPLDDIISEMLDFGFDADDLRHLESLSDKKVLLQMPIEERWLKHNIKNDVIKYITVWAEMLEKELLEKVQIPSIVGMREIHTVD